MEMSNISGFGKNTWGNKQMTDVADRKKNKIRGISI